VLDPGYVQLRHLTSPVVAITTSANGRRNGFIVNSAQRASLVPSAPRISLYVSKTNFSHDLVYSSGLLGVHLLRTDQWDLIWHLGLQSGREIDKLAAVETRIGETGVPMLVDCLTAYECRVVNAMDAGASTYFLADIVAVTSGRDGPVMTSEYFRANITPERKHQYESRLLETQKLLEPLAKNIERKPWNGAVSGP